MKTACTTQCSVCPFRQGSLRNWLGSYTAATITETVWKGLPFFCHSMIGYESKGWEKRAAKSGKLCRGSLVFAGKMGAPLSDDPEIAAARAAVDADPSGVDCMEPRAFGQWHDGVSAPFVAKVAGKPVKVKPTPKPVARKRTPAEVKAEIAALQDLLPRIRSYSAFGDDNRALLQAEIDALEQGWEEDDVYDGPLDERDLEREQEESEDSDDPIDHSREIEERRNQQNSAISAIQWRDGDAPEAPSDGWTPLVRD